MVIRERLDALRRYMAEAGLDACIITGTDPHGSEYPPPQWRTREWISGFTGSAGTVAVTANDAVLWTDFRYWESAEGELSDSGIRVFRDGSDSVPSCMEWLVSELTGGQVVGTDGRAVSARMASEWEDALGKAGIRLDVGPAPWDTLWTGRPIPEPIQASELEDEDSGESRAERIRRLREALELQGADTWIGTGLDSAAWLLNVRGADVPYVPVVTGFLILGPRDIIWYCDERKLNSALRSSLAEDGILTAPYGEFADGVAALPAESRVLIDRGIVSRDVWDRVPEGIRVIEEADPVMAMKARKNAVEAANIRRAMEKDGLAVVRFLKELDERIDHGDALDELEAAALLWERRRAIPGFLGNSFSPIPAVGGHGAICHYEARPGQLGILKKGNGLFLIDSGGQWEEGTTDITRTVTLGTPTAEQKTDYTLVLKGHVSLSQARFPRGTRGYQLDTLARMHLWRYGRDFDHGTGHGVGYRLSVHEGPQRVSKHPIDVALDEGMVISNEPGVYRTGRYGIRIENLLLCRSDEVTEFAGFLAFDTLTLAPYDRRLIDIDLLTDDERNWIDAYHAEVVRRLSPMMEPSEREWLEHRARPLG